MGVARLVSTASSEQQTAPQLPAALNNGMVEKGGGGVAGNRNREIGRRWRFETESRGMLGCMSFLLAARRTC